MFDEDRIITRYNRMRERNPDLVLLPLKKVIMLEKSRDILKERYLSRITGVTERFELIAGNGITLPAIIDFCRARFGEMNFQNRTNDEDGLVIAMAFTFCLVTITDNDGAVTCRVDPFWDL
jgi:hypothetical protein